MQSSRPTTMVRCTPAQGGLARAQGQAPARAEGPRRRARPAPTRAHKWSHQASRARTRFHRLRAEGGEAAPTTSTGSRLDPSLVPVCMLDDLPKGTRKEFAVDGKPILVFWYRNELYAIESRSSAEGYYSEGFKGSKFTQDFGIVCPTTQSIFSIKDGSIMEWYPGNPVLRNLTPVETCRPIEVYTCLARDGTVYVNPIGSLENWEPPSGSRTDFTMPGQMSQSTGGYDTSVEKNNVYGIEPKMYLEGEDVDAGSESMLGGEAGARPKIQPVTLIVSTIAAGIIGVAGTGVCVYYENFIALGLFWLAGFAAVATVALKYGSGAEDPPY